MSSVTEKIQYQIKKYGLGQIATRAAGFLGIIPYGPTASPPATATGGSSQVGPNQIAPTGPGISPMLILGGVGILAVILILRRK